MKEITLTIGGVEYIARPKNEPVVAEKPKTGYERVEDGGGYYAQDESCMVDEIYEDGDGYCVADYEAANYYNNESLAENIIRADTLMRRLRQWQALNDEPLDWSDNGSQKWSIEYCSSTKALYKTWTNLYRKVGVIYFSSGSKAQKAIEVFKDELTWYFTEYQQRLDEPKKSEGTLNDK